MVLLGDAMRRAECLQKSRLMRFGAYTGWMESRLSQERWRILLGVYSRTFWCYVEAGPGGLRHRHL